MGRRAPEFRRPVRWRLSCWICAILVLFFVVGSILFVVQHIHHSEDRVGQSVMEINRRIDGTVHTNYNSTEDMSSGTSFTRQLMEQMSLAKAYVIIAKEHNNLHLAWELSSRIRSCQSLLSEATTTAEKAEAIIRSLSNLILKAQDAHYDIATTMMTMENFIQSLEDRANAATVQSAVFGQMATESIPKNLQCFELKLSADWIQNRSLLRLAEDRRNSPRLVDNNLYHFCVFSDNVLAVSAVVNSTVSNAEHPQQLVFHIVTNGVKYGILQAWFLSNDFRGATVEVQNIDDFSWLHATSVTKLKPISLLNRLRFYIPQIHPQLEKVIFLEDDVIVHKDLTTLFALDLHGNVNGAVETCLEAFHRYYKYLNFSNPLISSKFDPQACAWAFGMNVFDLMAWRNENVTAKYEYWQQQQNIDKSIWTTTTMGGLPPGLLAFYGLTEPLDRRWHVLGLGYDMNIDDRLIETAAVIHFNGNMKPWLKMSMDRYKILWEKYVHYTHPYLQYCATI